MKKLILIVGLVFSVMSCSQNKNTEILIQKAQQGDVQAQYDLGVAYDNGYGVKQSDSQAVYWLQRACENFNDKACEFLNKIKK